MSKFRMKLKLQGLEVEIEGSRGDAPIIGRNVAEQISGLLTPAIQIVEGELSSASPKADIVVPPLIDHVSKRKSRRHSKPVTNGADKPSAALIDFRHDPAKFGTPTQTWSTSQKALWLLYVAKEHAGVPELSTGQIVKLFNTHFRQAKTVTSSNVSRDLGKAKIASPSSVGEDNSKQPATWYLTEEGIRQAQTLIAECLVPRAA